MLNKIMVFTLALLASGFVSAAEFGIGASLHNDSGELFFPIEIRTYLKIRDLLSEQGLSASKSAVYTE